MRKNNAHDVLERRARVADLYREGYHQYEIARAVGVSEPQITSDLKAIRAQWLESSVRNFDEAKSEELAKIDQLERTYWQAWHKSAKDYTKQSVKTKNNIAQGGKLIPVTNEEERKEIITFGDPRFLSGVMDCIKKRCEILGLNAPTKADLTSGGKPIEAAQAGINWNSLTMEQRDKIIQALGLNGDGDEPEEDEDGDPSEG